jgi:hypothetical protein
MALATWEATCFDSAARKPDLPRKCSQTNGRSGCKFPAVAIEPNDTFRATGATAFLPAGVYAGGYDVYGPFVERRPVLCDDGHSARSTKAVCCSGGPQGSGETVTLLFGNPQATVRIRSNSAARQNGLRIRIHFGDVAITARVE